MQKIYPVRLAYKALREIGPKQLVLYAKYQAGLRSGYLRWKTQGAQEGAGYEPTAPNLLNQQWIRIPSKETLLSIIGSEGAETLLAEADEIVSGQVRLFGGPPVPLQLTPCGPLKHWTAYENGQHFSDAKDIKWIWEPGRFSWAHTLARAYHLSGEEKYPEAFWNYTQEFLEANPWNMGPHWISAQEVALRLLVFTFASQLYLSSEKTTAERLDKLGTAIAKHASRIPPTLVYARAQNNNHLLTEAAALLSAGLALPEHPQAQRWKKTGWHWLKHGLQSQIAEDGTYVQHSTNYHRLMLQVALWASLVIDREFPAETQRRLEAATSWLLELVDPESGEAPNLGPNDSAYILPWTVCPLYDFRPVLQAASLAFLNAPAYPPGPWDEMSLWFGMDESGLETKAIGEQRPPPLTLPSKDSPIVLQGRDSWAYLRAANFESRPGHADQLHLDLWWRGLNLAQDAGTYQYSAAQPWDNTLARTQVHNTVTVEGQDQMTRAGRFLWLDWAQGKVLDRQYGQDGALVRGVAQHDGYRRLGIAHQRAVEHKQGQWIIKDTLLTITKPYTHILNRKSQFLIRLHWLLPDWSWEIEQTREAATIVRLDSPYGWITLRMRILSAPNNSNKKSEYSTQIYRAGELIHGRGSASSTLGWVSRNYGYKSPALSLSIENKSSLPLTFVTDWRFPD